MRRPRRFLVVADDTELLFLLSGVLHRKFPNANVQTCRDLDAALEAAVRPLDAVVASRSAGTEPAELIAALSAAGAAPLVAVSNELTVVQALAAGATRLIRPDEWLLVGTITAEVIGAS